MSSNIIANYINEIATNIVDVGEVVIPDRLIDDCLINCTNEDLRSRNSSMEMPYAGIDYVTLKANIINNLTTKVSTFLISNRELDRETKIHAIKNILAEFWPIFSNGLKF